MKKNINEISSKVRSKEFERYISILLSPPKHRVLLLSVCAFSLEILSIKYKVKEPEMGRIRILWWREALDKILNGESPQHPVSLALSSNFTSKLYKSLKLILDRSEDLFTDNDELSNDDFITISIIEGLTQASWLHVLNISNDIAELAAQIVGVAWGMVRNNPSEQHLSLAENKLEETRKLLLNIPKQAYPPLILGSVVSDIIDRKKTNSETSGKTKRQLLLLRSAFLRRF